MPFTSLAVSRFPWVADRVDPNVNLTKTPLDTPRHHRLHRGSGCGSAVGQEGGYVGGVSCSYTTLWIATKTADDGAARIQRDSHTVYSVVPSLAHSGTAPS